MSSAIQCYSEKYFSQVVVSWRQRWFYKCGDLIDTECGALVYTDAGTWSIQMWGRDLYNTNVGPCGWHSDNISLTQQNVLSVSVWKSYDWQSSSLLQQSKQPVVKVRGKAGERHSWAVYNCWRAFTGPTLPLTVQAGWEGPFQLTVVGHQIFLKSSWGPKFILLPLKGTDCCSTSKWGQHIQLFLFHKPLNSLSVAKLCNVVCQSAYQLDHTIDFWQWIRSDIDGFSRSFGFVFSHALSVVVLIQCIVCSGVILMFVFCCY